MSLPEPFYKLLGYINTGGVVMIPLALNSLIMWVLIIDRALFFRRLYRKNMDSRTALTHISDNQMPDPARYKGIVSMLVAEFIQRRSSSNRLDRFILDETVLRINHRLSDHLGLIGVLAAMAPLLGLLGTVTGMITTFDVLSIYGTGNIRAVAGGISEALITTQTGLMIAIPGMCMKGILERRASILKKKIAAVGYYLRRNI